MTIALLRRRWVDVALLVAALAAVLAVVATRRSVSSAEAEARARNVLVAFRPSELTRIVLERGRERVVLERAAPAPGAAAAGASDTLDPGADDEGAGEAGDEAAADEWKLVEPRGAAAGTFQVRSFVDALDHAVFLRRVEAGDVDRERAGLTAPRAVVSLAMGSLAYRLLVGGEAASPAGAVYLEVTGDGVPGRGVGIVRRETADALAIGVDDLREPALAPYGPAELARVVVEGGGQRLELTRDHRRWLVTIPGGRRLGERTLVSLLFTELGRLNAEVAVPIADARQRVAAARVATLELHPTEGRPMTRLELGGTCPQGEGVVAIRTEPAPLAGCVPADIGRLLAQPRERWLSRHLFGFGPDEVETLLIESAGARLELARREQGFRLRAPRAADVELEAGNGRILALVEVRGERLEAPDLSALGLAAPTGTVTLTSAAATEAEAVTEVLEVGAPGADGAVAVRRRLDGAVLRVDRDTARGLLPDSTLLRPRELFAYEASAVRRVEMTGAVEQVLVQGRPGEFTLERPTGFRVDGGLAADLVDALVKLEADRWIADTDDGSFGLGEPTLRVRLTLEAEPGRSVQRELRVGLPTAGGAFAAVDGDPGVFVLPERIRLRCERLLLDRTLWPGDPGSLVEVGIEAGAISLVLARLGDGFEQVAGERRLGEAELARLTTSLGELRAEAALHPGPARPEEGLERPLLTLQLKAEGQANPRRIRFGAGDAWQGLSVHYARIDGIDATFVVPRAVVASILDAL